MGSITVRSGVVTLGDAERMTVGVLRADVAGIQFYSGSSIRALGGVNTIVLSRKEDAVVFHHRSVVDISEGSLLVSQGRMIVHGEVLVGCLEDDPLYVNYISVDRGEGRVVLGDRFSVRLSERMVRACCERPEDIIEDTVVVDAVITKFRYRYGEEWVREVSTVAGEFLVMARLGVDPAEGGGLRLLFRGGRKG